MSERKIVDTKPTLGFLYEIGNCGKVRAPERRYPPEIESDTRAQNS